MRDLFFTKAVSNLVDGIGFHCDGTDYDSLVIVGTSQKPSKETIDAEIARLEAFQAATEYQRQRVAEYPPITDYLDGVVKGDQAQIDAYIAACQAVKTKYPKPESV